MSNELTLMEAQDLKQAFHLFSQVSEQLAQSYHSLEHHIKHLQAELSTVDQQRLSELAEKELLTNRLQKLFAILPCGIVLLDGNGMVSKYNPQAENLLGTSLQQKYWLAIIKQVFTPRADDGHEISIINGKKIRVDTRSLEPEPGQLIVLTDLTETRKLQHIMARQQRLSEMGRMTAQLAHQIRTPLATAMLYASHLSDNTIEPTKRAKFSTKLTQQLQHIEQQIHDMLAFTRGCSQQFTAINLSDLLQELKVSVESQVIASHTQLDILLESSDVVIQGNKSALLGALQNIVINAIQATRNYGELTITVKPCSAGLIDIIVHDNGPGIPSELCKKVLEPFFTTQSQGTGLGLAIAHAVAKAHYGDLWIDSIPNQGTDVGLRLPLYSAEK